MKPLYFFPLSPEVPVGEFFTMKTPDFDIIDCFLGWLRRSPGECNGMENRLVADSVSLMGFNQTPSKHVIQFVVIPPQNPAEGARPVIPHSLWKFILDQKPNNINPIIVLNPNNHRITQGYAHSNVLWLNYDNFPAAKVMMGIMVRILKTPC